MQQLFLITLLTLFTHNVFAQSRIEYGELISQTQLDREFLDYVTRAENLHFSSLDQMISLRNTNSSLGSRFTTQTVREMMTDKLNNFNTSFQNYIQQNPAQTGSRCENFSSESLRINSNNELQRFFQAIGEELFSTNEDNIDIISASSMVDRMQRVLEILSNDLCQSSLYLYERFVTQRIRNTNRSRTTFCSANQIEVRERYARNSLSDIFALIQHFRVVYEKINVEADDEVSIGNHENFTLRLAMENLFHLQNRIKSLRFHNRWNCQLLELI